MRAPVSTELMEPEITNVLTITCRTAVFLFALLSVSAVAQAPVSGVTQIDAVLALRIGLRFCSKTAMCA